MKKLAIVLAIIIAPMMSFGQGIFDKYEDMEGVTSFVINQKMFSMLASINIELDDPEDKAFMDMAKKITGLKVYTTGNEKTSADMNSTVKSYLASTKLEELMRMKDGEQTVNFYVKEGKDENHVKELLMVINGLKEFTKGEDITINGKKRDFETVVLSLTGDIDLRQISKMTEKMNVPGGDKLNKAGKAKKDKMTSLIKHIVVMVVLVATLYSCDQNPSLQTYFVDNQEQPNFLSLDVPVSMLNIDESQLTDDQKVAYRSVQKLNMLAFRKDSINSADYKAEMSRVKSILDDKKYEELMRGGNATEGKFIIKYLGEDDDIDEFILFGSSNDMGFAVVRILGDNMDPNKLMQLSSVLEKSNVDDSQINQVMDFFK